MKWFFPLIVFTFFLQLTIAAQLTDDFSDGNLNGWEGDVNHFIVNGSNQLQLNAPSGSTSSWLYSTLTFTDSMSWDMYIKLDFAPSTTNQLRIYLGLTTPDLSTASGYFLEIGASGDLDALDLKYLNGGASQLIASSTPGLVASEPVELRIRITKNSSGLWQCYNSSETIPELLFSATHDLVPLSMLTTFGFYCKYSDTRRDKFFFDDILIQPVQADINPPSWISLTVIDEHAVMLVFDEIVDPVIAMDPLHYNLSPGNTSPDEIEVNGNEIILTWNQAFVSQQNYTLTVTDLKDLAGNIMSLQSRDFIFTKIDGAAANEILITEIMADPTPAIGLPDAEYVELLNHSTKVFNLSDYTLKIGSGERSLPDSILFPGQLVILTDDANFNSLSSFGRVIIVDNFPALTNVGTTVSLLNQSGEVIHEINYTTAWYHNSEKSEGGWSLEMINPFHICSNEENWSASTDLRGGTPGQQNSQWMTTPDVTGPALVSLFTGNDAMIELRFNEKIDPTLMADPGLYSFSPGLIITQIELTSPTVLVLHLNDPLLPNTTYQLLPFDAFDCLGNSRKTDTLVFGLVVPAATGDILINEILFNPATGGNRFIEIINTGEKFIDLSTLSIARLSQNNIYPVEVTEIISPGSIVVFTPDPADILSRYTVPFPDKMYASTLPAWDDKTDDVAILAGGMVIDSFTYSSSWHHPVIADQNGVSLERISTESPTQDRSNWHSASSLSGYGTPTGINSQTVGQLAGIPPFTITNRHFSPNDDGYKDFLLLSFELDSGDDVASIWVYDLEGREIHQLLSNEIIGNSAIIQWDGRNAEGQLADMGIYLIFIRLWDTAGNGREYQESCALVKR